jgi:Na+-transporting methylmalonyl-CoA/oxaloacetate decarboxylase gamma subunit
MQSAPVIQSAARPVGNPMPHQPVLTSRYGQNLRPVSQPTSARKIRYHVGANGVETRLFSLPVFKFNWQWVSGIMAVVLLILVLMMTNMSAFVVNSINVEGLQRLTVDDLSPVVQVNAGSAFILDRAELTKAIAIAFPELQNIHVAVKLPASVTISVTERQPVLAWSTTESTWWVDSEGVVFTPRGEASGMLFIASVNSIPLTTNVTSPRTALEYAAMVINRQENPITPESAILYINPTVMKAAMDLSTQMPQGATLVYDSIAGMGWQDPRGWNVFFGTNLEDMPTKNIAYQAIVDRLTALGITPTTISVEYADAPYYRTE